MSAGPARSGSPLERVLEWQAWIVLGILAVVVLMALYLMTAFGNALMMADMMDEGGPSLAAREWMLFGMWLAMMVAMMLPSASPAILTYRTVSRKFALQGAQVSPLWLFICAYLAIWTVFSAIMVVLQLAGGHFLALNAMYATDSRYVAGGILAVAGIYQFTSIKQGCLTQCQSPLMYFARNWQPGRWAGFKMGLRYGVYCLGCCWLLMGLLFYGGVMEMKWIIGVAIYVGAEKFIPAKFHLSSLVGAALILLGLMQISGLLHA